MPILTHFGSKINENMLDAVEIQWIFQQDVQFEEAESRLETSNAQKLENRS